MPECRYCGQQFDDERSIRQHLYWVHDTDELSRIDRKRAERFVATVRSEGHSPMNTDNLDMFRADASPDRALDALQEYDTALQRTRSYDGREAYQELFWASYEVVAGQLDDVVQQAGWPVLAEVIDAFDPRSRQDCPLITPVIANVVGRFVIRTRLSEDVTMIPDAALAYLGALPRYTGPTDTEFHGEATVYGWGIGHPTHPVTDTISEIATDDVEWAHSALCEAFWADQHEAVALLERLVTADEVPRSRFLIGCVGLVDSFARTRGSSGGIHPRYWTWDDLNVRFAWDVAVADRIQELVATMARDDATSSVWPDPDTDWTFDDLRI